MNAETEREAAATVARVMDPVGWGERWTQEFRTHTAQVEELTLSFMCDPRATRKAVR